MPLNFYMIVRRQSRGSEVILLRRTKLIFREKLNINLDCTCDVSEIISF